MLAGPLLRKIKSGEINRLLFVATGALMSPTSTFQGESIPGIAHAVAIENL
jgi:stage V sporulation protein AD